MSAMAREVEIYRETIATWVERGWMAWPPAVKARRISPQEPAGMRCSISAVDEEKNPERVRTGRLGALTVHARGRTNTASGSRRLGGAVAAEFGIGDDLDRRARAAHGCRDAVRMVRLARARWSKKPVLVVKTAEDRRGGVDRGDNPTAA